MPRTAARKSQPAAQEKVKAKPKPRRRVAKPAEVQPLKRKEMLDRTRIAILQSALSHFSRQGFGGASLRDIAAEANVNHGMIRHIYGSKEGLWRATITFLFARVNFELNEDPATVASVSERERMKTLIRRYVAYCAKHPEHARLMVQQSIMGGTELAWAAEQFIKSRHDRDQPFFERLMASGDLPQVDTLALHFIIIGAAQMIYLLAPEVRAVNGKDVFEPAAVQKHADALVKILFR